MLSPCAWPRRAMRDREYPLPAAVLEDAAETPVQTAGREAEERWKRTGFAGGGVVRGVVVGSWCVVRGWRVGRVVRAGSGWGLCGVVAWVGRGLARVCARGRGGCGLWF